MGTPSKEGTVQPAVEPHAGAGADVADVVVAEGGALVAHPPMAIQSARESEARRMLVLVDYHEPG